MEFPIRKLVAAESVMVDGAATLGQGRSFGHVNTSRPKLAWRRTDYNQAKLVEYLPAVRESGSRRQWPRAPVARAATDAAPFNFQAGLK
jgi:hypothetical protein